MEVDQELNNLSQQSLSPVLGTTNNNRKFIKRIKSNKEKIGIKLNEIFEKETIGQNENIKQLKHANWTQTKNVSDQVEIHSFVEKNESNACNNISGFKDHEKSVGLGFQTASGKQLFPCEDSSKFANELLEEFFNPTQASTRENKYKFLSKSSFRPVSSVFDEVKLQCGTIVDCLGFEEKECIQSEEKCMKVQQVIETVLLCFKYPLPIVTDKTQCIKKRKSESFEVNVPPPTKRFAVNTEDRLPQITPQFSKVSVETHEVSTPTFCRVNKMFEAIAVLETPEDEKTKRGLEIDPSQFSVMPFKEKFSDTTYRKNDYVGNFEDNKSVADENMPQFSTASGKKIEISSVAISRVNKMFNDVPDFNSLVDKKHNKNDMHKTFQSSNSMLLKNNTPRFNSSGSTYETCQIESSSGFSTASGKKIKLPAASLSRVNKIFKDIPDLDNIKVDSIPVSVSKLRNEELRSKTLLQKTENFNYSNHEQNKEVKEETVTPVRSIPKKKRLGTSGYKDGKISDTALSRVKSLFGDMNFDDLKLPGNLRIGSPSYNSPRVTSSTPIGFNKIVSTPQFSSSFVKTPVSHVRKLFMNRNDFLCNDLPQELNCPFLIQKPTTSSLAAWAEELNRQKLILEKKLALISKKHEAVAFQLNESAFNEEKTFQPIANKINTVNLKDVRNLEIQSNRVDAINNVILQINPQNATFIHFNGDWADVATVTTEDGCTMVPNQQGLIGISEIEHAFKAMPGIKRNLITDGWVKNHYKWIIWKLASYERFFPATLGGCFNIDNVIKQLKYRYSKELYNAERPALRKIFEMDDVCQKRMILCISNIFKNGDSVELELTDGWYSIRTLVDEPLCYQINNQKIRIGSKIIISGAELLNCEGCHPLETEQAQKVRLKINFNATRRAAWFSKLGYQKNPMPFLIKLESANPAGGLIGEVKVYIMRTYPLIYREKTQNSVVWRNQNAEYKALQEFENQCFKQYDEGVHDQNNKNVNGFTKRNVTPVFQMTVIDVMGDKSKPYRCIIWDSTDFHQEQLKENQIVSFYNVTLRSNYELSCNKKTRFEISKMEALEYIKYRRKFVALGSYNGMLENSTFGEFDTVGFVVKIHVDEQNQYFWLTDLSKNLLLIKISESPKSCLLLNRIQEGQQVAVCNLTLKEGYHEFVSASANCSTIVTNYPQYKFLREELEKLSAINKSELDFLLNESRENINHCLSKKTLQSTSHSGTSDENTLNFCRITSTDMVMAMINIDEVVNSTK